MKSKKLEEARIKLAEQTGLSVGSAIGYPDGIKGIEGGASSEEFLIVWSDKKVNHPKLFDGFKVVRRGIPRAL